MSNSDSEKTKEENNKLSSDGEPKVYTNFYCCKLSVNILFSLSYVTAAI